MPDDPFGVRAPERETLTGTLDWYRQVATNKIDGLSLDQAATILTPTGLSPLGVIKHLAWVEIGWFRDTFAGEPMGEELPVDVSFRISADDTISSVVTEYEVACAHSRRIVDGARSLGALSVRAAEIRGQVSLRWLLVHLIEETARHAGQLDLMRESLDGRTGI